MRKGDLPIPHIIGLIIGIAVVALLVYWLVFSSGKGTGVGTEAQCTAKKLEYCTTQTNDAKTAAETTCNKQFSLPEWCDFCKIIPNWKPLQGECPKSTTG